jgi:Ca2+-binding RTX toxin-like protein
MLIEFFGRTTDYFQDAFFSSGDNGFNLTLLNTSPTSFSGENPDTGFVTTFTGTGLPVDPSTVQTGNVTGYSTVTEASLPVLTASGFDWTLENLLAAFISYVNGTGINRLNAMYSLQDITFDATTAVSGAFQSFAGVTSHITFLGSGFGDNLEGGLNDDTISGGAGNDTLRGGDGRDVMNGGDGDDVINSAGGIAATQDSGDVIAPGRGTNTISGHAAAFSLGLGAGVDITYDDVTGSGGVTITVVTNGTGSTVSNVGGVINDTFTYADRFQGTHDADTFIGSGGALEIWTGEGGNDTINGNGGNDIVSYLYEGGSMAISVNMELGIATDTYGDTDTLLNIEDVHGSIHADYMMGALNRNDGFFGGWGDDTMFGASGNDRLDGGEGDDLMNGGPGSDTYVVDSENDRISESRKWAGTDTVLSLVDFRMGSRHIENLTLLSDAVLGAGNGLTNLIVGNDADNILDGGKNIDTLIGGMGNDTYLIRSPGDNALEQEDEGIDTVKAFRSHALEDHVERLLLQTTVHLNGIGNSLDNTIVGNNANNTLFGREGNDVLKGQAGNDTFLFDRAFGAGNVDRIIDFEVNGDNDTLKFKASILGGVLSAGTLAAGNFALGTAAADANDRFIFDQATGQLWFDIDGTGAAAQELVATFDQNVLIDAADILIF